MANLLRSEELRSYLRQNLEFIVNRKKGRVDESENEISYITAHIDRVMSIFSLVSSLSYVPHPPSPLKLKSLLLRPRQVIVATGVNNKSLQGRFFKFTDIPKEILELYLEHNFTPA